MMFSITMEPKQFKIQVYSYKEMINFYGVSWKTFKSWISKVPDLGEYSGKKFTPAQVEKIVKHLGEP